MKISVTGSFEIPDVIASLLLGARIDPSIPTLNDFTVTLDEDGTNRLATILTMLYTPAENLRIAKETASTIDVGVSKPKVITYSPRVEVPARYSPQSAPAVQVTPAIAHSVVSDTHQFESVSMPVIPEIDVVSSQITVGGSSLSIDKIKSRSKSFIK